MRIFKNKSIHTYILFVLFILTMCLSIKVTKRATNSMIEGDAASELVLSHNLSASHNILSHDWYYGSELRVFNTQIIFSFLFNFLNDWGKVRFYGTIFMHVILLLSFTFMMRQANQSWASVIFGSILLLLPYCVAYGRIALYQSFYLPHLTFGFLLPGLLFSVIRNCNNSKRIDCFLSLTALFLISFLSCLNGIRYIAEIMLPVTLVYILNLLIRNRFTVSNDRKESALWYIALIGMIFFGFLGFLVNKRTLLTQYSAFNFSERILTIRTYFESSILQCILHQFGFRTNIPMLSLVGILSLAGLFVCVYCFYLSFHSLQENQASFNLFLMRQMMITCTACIVFEMYLIKGLEICTRYFISSSVWMIPLLCTYFDKFIEQKTLDIKKMSYILCIATLLINGLLNMSYFLNPEGIAKQPYEGFEGIDASNPNLVRDLKRPMQFIVENQYEYGFAPFWEASTITEKTNGIPVSSVKVEKDQLIKINLLTLKSYDFIETDKVFLMLDVTNAQYFPDFDVSFQWKEIYRDNHYVIYDVNDLNQIREYFIKNN